MIYDVRIIESVIITILLGVDCNPSAILRMDREMMRRVNDVMQINAAGMTEIKVMRIAICINESLANCFEIRSISIISIDCPKALVGKIVMIASKQNLIG